MLDDCIYNKHVRLQLLTVQTVSYMYQPCVLINRLHDPPILGKITVNKKHHNYKMPHNEKGQEIIHEISISISADLNTY